MLAMAPRPRGSVSLEITDEDILDKMTEDELWDWYQAGRSRYQVGKEARRRWEKKAVAAAPAEEAPEKAMKTGRPRSVRACADIWALHLCMKKKAASAEEASQSHKKAIQKGMEKAAAPAEEAHKKAMQKGMKKKAVSTEKAHWKSLKKRMKRAITRRAPGEPPPKKPRQKGTLTISSEPRRPIGGICFVAMLHQGTSPAAPSPTLTLRRRSRKP